MYLPDAFKEERLEVLHAAIRSHPFAILTTMGSKGGLIASHLPLVLDPGGSELGTLHGHLARPNPQWRDFDPAVPALVIFQGPHAYVSPSLYPSKKEHGKVVPTWNYITVHAYGALRVVEEQAALRRHLESLTDQQEAGRAAPWAVRDAPESFTAALMRGVVAVEILITRIEGKWKLSQNRTPAERAGVVDGLGTSERPDDLAVAAAMRERAGSDG